MCFSANASFASAALLIAAGAVTLRLAEHAGERAFAAIPLLFGIQQLVEGLLWVRIADADTMGADGLALLYSLFAYLLWPAYVPIAVWRMERRAGRRRLLGWLAAASLLLEAFLVFSLWSNPLSVRATGGHIAYEQQHLYFLAPLVMLAYVLATCGALLLSSQAFVRLFGLAALASLGVTFAVYAQWFVSVWCFLAGLLSLLVLLHFLARRSSATRQATALLPDHRPG